ncbi:TPA: translation initiation factor IF-5A [Candidatus Woesearchaeota archaeon]|nr:Translation initiation factor 5A [archaeon GW2011_AR15]MBS3103348.1 translation initiation factor IF-5A [Candidatus Woesearchaeota archaeon]HIH42002.1 translation initiation factor IF-5A [Candidatus Woesearchaeota archaeon]
MAGTKLSHVGSMKKGNYIVLEGVACIVSNTQTSRPGKHGHAKVRLEAVGIIDGKKRQVVMPGHDNVEVPVIDKLNAQVLSISGDMANVMDMESYETFDMKVPEELKDKLTAGMTVLYWGILGDRVIKQIKAD